MNSKPSAACIFTISKLHSHDYVHLCYRATHPLCHIYALLFYTKHRFPFCFTSMEIPDCLA